MAKTATGRTSKVRRRSKNQNAIGYWIIGISAAVVILVIALAALNSRQSVAEITPPDVPAEWVNGTSLGNPDAPVTVQMWEDFLCPHCRQWTNQIKPQLEEAYVKTGQVKLEYHFFPLQSFAPGSEMAAMAGMCAADQNAFWPYHDRLFQAQDQGQAGYLLDALVQYADELGLDSRTFLQCMSSQKYRTAVQESANQAIALGFTGTPSIMINGQQVENAFDYNGLAAEIDRLLAASGSN